jgi:hypothetical protein
MPPGDTTIYNSFDELPDSLRQLVDSLMHVYPGKKLADQGPQYLLPEWGMFMVVFLILAVSAYFYILRPTSAKKRKIRSFLKEDSTGKAIYEIQYDHWLGKYNSYYSTLPGELKKRFLRRTLEFKESKEFHYHFIKEEEYMPVLISGAAVQLTFGLRNYLIEYFPVVNVIQKEYKIPHHDEIFEGHVSNQSISISWNNFMAGYENYSDAENLGLHELAHAISFGVFNSNDESYSDAFKKRLKEYAEEARPVFKELRQGKRLTLDDYAATNFEEFWAVSVESFFENSVEFRDKMPGLYEAICDLLNQDPLRPEKIIDKKLAGLAG